MARCLSIALALALWAPAPAASADPSADPSAWVDPDADSSFHLGLDLVSVEKRPDETRVGVLDLIAFKLFSLERREKDGYLDLEVLGAGPVGVFERKVDADESSLRVLKVPFFSLFRRDREGDERVDTRVLDLPLVGSLFRTRLHDDRRRTSILFLLDVETSE